MFTKRIVKRLKFMIVNGISIELNSYALIRPTVPGGFCKIKEGNRVSEKPLVAVRVSFTLQFAELHLPSPTSSWAIAGMCVYTYFNMRQQSNKPSPPQASVLPKSILANMNRVTSSLVVLINSILPVKSKESQSNAAEECEI
ncbi:hypothetical protein JHK87_000611 [Glycine soja]|nr:hypothetical protein JHK87_000611 [Glycine soja]